MKRSVNAYSWMIASAGVSQEQADLPSNTVNVMVQNGTL
jgi:hypothetical protein